MRIMILGCLLKRVARAYYSAFGHGTARAHLIARAARLLFVCYTMNLFCAARVARALWLHFYTLKFILVFLFLFCFVLFCFSEGDREMRGNSSRSFFCTQICRGPYGFALGFQIKFFFLFSRMSKLPSFEQCRQKSDKQR